MDVYRYRKKIQRLVDSERVAFKNVVHESLQTLSIFIYTRCFGKKFSCSTQPSFISAACVAFQKRVQVTQTRQNQAESRQKCQNI